MTAAIAFVVKGVVIPVGAASRWSRRLGIHREIETVIGVGPTMLAGIGLVALSIVVMLRGDRRPSIAGARGPRLRAGGRSCSAC